MATRRLSLPTGTGDVQDRSRNLISAIRATATIARFLAFSPPRAASSSPQHRLPDLRGAILKVGYRRILDHIYSPKHFYERVRTFLREYQLPMVKTPVTMEGFRAFFRSVWHLGVRGGERRHYWSLLAWTLVRRPRLIPLAVTLAIHGHHFRRVTELQGL